MKTQRNEARKKVINSISKNYKSVKQIADDTGLLLNTVWTIIRRLDNNADVDFFVEFDHARGTDVTKYKAKKIKGRIIRFDEMTEQVIAQAKQLREDYVSPKVYVSGSTLNELG